MRRLTSRRRRRWLWRWRSNPLRRRDDVVETWIVLAMWVVIGLGGTLVGVVTAQAAEASFAQLRHDRHSARVVLVENTTRAVQTGEGSTYRHVRAKVRWTAPDGSVRIGRAPVDSGRNAGSRVTVWLDSNGQFTEKPTAAKAAAVEAGTLGTGAALAFGGLVFAAGRLAQWRLDQRRYDRWGREWEQVGPRWGRRTT
ncbi:Rv1733c family protein [Streptomyces sp. NPDC055817]